MDVRPGMADVRGSVVNDGSRDCGLCIKSQ